MISSNVDTYKFHASHPGFSPEWYLAVNPDVRSSNMDPIVHYCSFGASEGRDPSPFFDTKFYLKQVERSETKISSSMTPLLHYSSIGWKLGLCPNYLFDTNFYVQNLHIHSVNPLLEDDDPLSHFLKSNGRVVNPHPLFDFEWVDYKYRDLDDCKINTWCHYILLGWKERRITHPDFSPQFVERQIHQLGLVHTADIDFLRFYLDYAIEIGIEPNRFFDSKFYTSQIIESCPKVIDQRFNPLVHFVTSGQVLGLKRNPVINEEIGWQRRPKSQNSKYLLEAIVNSLEGFPIETHPVLTSTVVRHILQNSYNDVFIHP
jgi:hypothetical protein